MAIKMRNNIKSDSVCCECGGHRIDVLDMFDICIGGKVFTICDICNEVLLNKTLHAECVKNGRVKTPHDMAIIRRRVNGSYVNSYKAKWFLRQEKTKAKGEDYGE